MIVVRSLEAVRHDRNSVVTVGTFDGVHVAHRQIIRDVVDHAKMREGRSVVLTFDPHPKEVVQSPKGPVQLLSTVEEKIGLLGELGVDVLFVVSFTAEFSRLAAREFYQKYVVAGVGASEVVVGYDHMFGRDRKAGIEELMRMGKEFDFSVFAVAPVSVDGEVVSSTRIRKALGAGEIERATGLLGNPYLLSGTVVRGDGRGRTVFGFPTANIAPEDPQKVVPGRGVYAVGIQIDGAQYFGMLNIGTRPTVTQSQQVVIEVHIFNFDRDIYGSRVVLSFFHRLRDERRFSTVRELIEQLGRDRDAALGLLADRVRTQQSRV